MLVGTTARAVLARETAAPVAYVVMDADSGTVLAEHDAHKRWPPASMAKMMTVLIAMERVRDGSLTLDTPVRASAWASRIGGSQVYLAEGETFPLGELLKAVMIASANDAAVAVAEHIAGSTAAFVELMNARAKALGLADTTYQSPHGLPPGAGRRSGRCRSRAVARRASRRWRWATSACSSSAARTKAWSSRRTYRAWCRRRSSSASHSATSSSAAVIRSSGGCPW